MHLTLIRRLQASNENFCEAVGYGLEIRIRLVSPGGFGFGLCNFLVNVLFHLQVCKLGFFTDWSFLPCIIRL